LRAKRRALKTRPNSSGDYLFPRFCPRDSITSAD
jgi:hypothetical protein